MAAPVPVPLIGKLDSFDESAEDWTSYIERADEYLVLNGLPDEKKDAAIITSMGAKTYSILRKLTTPSKPSEKTYEEIKKHLRLLFACAAGNALRDKFVCGLRSVQVQQRLLTMKKFTLKHALDEAVAHELAAKDIAEFKNKEETPTATVAQVAHVDNDKQKCFRCNRKGHAPAKCRFLEAVCHKCNKVGHISPACRSKANDATKTSHRPNSTSKKASQRPLKSQVHVARDEDSAEFEFLAHIDNGSRSNPIWLKPRVEGQTLEMEMDTGSKYSLLPKALYEKHLLHVPLQATPVLFKTLTGETFSPEGVATTEVTFGKSTGQLQLYVVDTPGPPLFGRDWINHFNLLELSNVLKVDSQLGLMWQDQLDKRLAEFKDVFDDKEIKSGSDEKSNVVTGQYPTKCRLVMRYGADILTSFAIQELLNPHHIQNPWKISLLDMNHN
ncbi:uncharacterized protein LOC120840306 [Ixodes scapularis]|uniref:uncharacterized protein LOC120840306 n=1 Tax=Ixodes scapularis TaxID=6945 RepID=UPI001A9FD8BE|nr:uncharacterized protein LOC120840306 [Ixodes scapularis]